MRYGANATTAVHGLCVVCVVQVGNVQWRALRDTYPTITNCGFTDDEIDSATGLVLFTRITPVHGLDLCLLVVCVN